MSDSIKNKSGFSLIEGLVAISIAAVALLAIISAFPLVIKSNKRTEFESMASTYAKAKMETMLTTSYDEINTGTVEARIRLSADLQNPAYNFERQTVVQLVDSNLNQTVTDIGLKKIIITVYWKDILSGNNTLTVTGLTAQK
jgi:prepilin-type N-terminal cleavage/methylation domain-containing protein